MKSGMMQNRAEYNPALNVLFPFILPGYILLP